MITIKTVLVATDLGEAADSALRFGRGLARRFGASLHVLNVVENFYVTTFGAETYAVLMPEMQRSLETSAQQRLDHVLRRNDVSGPPTTPVVMTSGSPAYAIVDYAREHDVNLIVLGTHGRTGLSHVMMGSVAEKVVRLAPCPVLTIRHPEESLLVPEELAVAAMA